MSDNRTAARFLLVEDDDDHADLVLRAMREHRMLNAIDRVSDGEAAIEHLRRAAEGERALPDVVLLDLNLPRLDGHEVLARIKSDPKLAHIPVVILTTSEAERDVARAYNSHANSYVVKPLNFQQFNDMVRNLQLYWAVWNVNTLSSSNAGPAPQTTR